MRLKGKKCDSPKTDKGVQRRDILGTKLIMNQKCREGGREGRNRQKTETADDGTC